MYFRTKILEQHPNKKEIEASAPTAQDRDRNRASRQAERHELENPDVFRRNFVSGLPGSPNRENEKPRADQGLVPDCRNARVQHLQLATSVRSALAARLRYNDNVANAR